MKTQQITTIDLKKAIKVGGSYLVTLPNHWVKSRHLKRGQQLIVTVEGDTVVVTLVKENADEGKWKNWR